MAQLEWKITKAGEEVPPEPKFNTAFDAIKYLAEADLPDGGYELDLFDTNQDDCYMESIPVVKIDRQVICSIRRVK